MRTDALTSSRPIIVAVTNPDEINQAFDGISYDKGASMLRMIEYFMGTQNFTNGLRVRFFQRFLQYLSKWFTDFKLELFYS